MKDATEIPIDYDCNELDLWRAAVTSATALAGIFSFADFFSAVASHMATLMDANGAGLVVHDGEDHLRFKIFHGLPRLNERAISEFRFQASEGIAGQVLATGTPMFTADYPNSPYAMREFVVAGVTASLAVPLAGPTGYIGVMVIVWFSQPPKKLEQNSQLIVGMFAALVSSALYREDLEEQLKQQTLHDVLTGLPNRRLLMIYLDEAQERAKRKQSQFALGILDLDGFKQVNDKFGHLMGDHLLVSTARCIRSSLRATDKVARLGGDEFVVILEDVQHVDEVEAVFKRIITAIRRQVDEDARTYPIGASVGVALYPLHAGDPEALLNQADIAMYLSKAAGGNQVVFAGPGLQSLDELAKRVP